MKENELIKFSVVLPIYNVEKYLKRCMDSILNQTYTNLEIIMVDDGSPDNCPALCDEYAKNDSRIKVIHKQNAGLGMARNTGIEHATGDYICFFDSDDFVSTDLFEICAKELEKESFDVIAFDSSVFKNGEVINTHNRTSRLVFKGEDVQTVYLRRITDNRDDQERLFANAWSKVYSLRLIKEKGFRYASEREYISEDYYSNLVLFKDVKSVLCLPNALYFYCYNDASLTHAFNENRFEKIVFQYEQSIKKCDELGYSNEIKNAIAFQSLGNLFGAFRGLLLADQVSAADKKKKIYEVVSSARYQCLYQNLVIRGKNLGRRMLIWALKGKRCRIAYVLLKLKYKN